MPIIPGLKLIDSVRQLTTLPKHFHVTIPDELVDEIMASPRARARRSASAGAGAGARSCSSAGAPCIHFYVMNDASPVLELIRELG